MAPPAHEFVPAVFAMCTRLLDGHEQRGEDVCVEIVRSMPGCWKQYDLLAAAIGPSLALRRSLKERRPQHGRARWDATVRRDPVARAIACLDIMLESMNAECIASITALYFGHGVCCHELGALWRQTPRTIIGRMERGYAIRPIEPPKKRTPAELEELAAKIDVDPDGDALGSHEMRHALVAFAPLLHPVPESLWQRLRAA